MNWGKVIKEGHLGMGLFSSILCFDKDIHKFWRWVVLLYVFLCVCVTSTCNAHKCLTTGSNKLYSMCSTYWFLWYKYSYCSQELGRDAHHWSHKDGGAQPAQCTTGLHFSIQGFSEPMDNHLQVDSGEQLLVVSLKLSSKVHSFLTRQTHQNTR